MSAPVAPSPPDASPTVPAPDPAFRGAWRTDAPARAAYAEAAGIAQAMPRAVAVPASADDAQRLVRWAAESGTPLVPRGSGSSMAGGAIGDGVIVDVSRLTTMGRVDVAARRLLVGPGVLGAQVDAHARESGLRFPIDPSSWAFCTIGGMAASNAAGAHSLRHGTMRRWVTALDCVFADGTRAVVRRGAPPPDVPAVHRFLDSVAPAVRAAGAGGALRRAVRKDSSGYGLADWLASGALVDLLAGSEGSLALFVGVEVALARLPGATASVLAAFPSLDAAVAGAISAREVGAVACELLDRTFLDVAARDSDPRGTGGRRTGWRAPRGTEAVLLAEMEGDSRSDAGDAARQLRRVFQSAGATEVALALEPSAERALWALRHAASPILARLDPDLKSMQFIEDGAVPPARLAEYVRGVRAALARHAMRGVIFGHAGDAHVHVNPLVDVREPDWRTRVAALLEDVTDLAARLGGTLAGEHGDGRLRTPLMARTWPPEALALFAATKQAFDPAGILNPGVKVPLAGQTALDVIKYDPALAPLPAAARRALDHVADARAYASHRLTLVDGGLDAAAT